MRDQFHWARILSFVTGLVNQELLLRNEYLAAGNRILRAHLPARLRLSDAERCTLAENDPPSNWSSSHLRRIILSERSNPFKSHWSNQWLTNFS
jgi:hypothetical protein